MDHRVGAVDHQAGGSPVQFVTLGNSLCGSCVLAVDTSGFHEPVGPVDHPWCPHAVEQRHGTVRRDCRARRAPGSGHFAARYPAHPSLGRRSSRLRDGLSLSARMLSRRLFRVRCLIAGTHRGHQHRAAPVQVEGGCARRIICSACRLARHRSYVVFGPFGAHSDLAVAGTSDQLAVAQAHRLGPRVAAGVTGCSTTIGQDQVGVGPLRNG